MSGHGQQLAALGIDLGTSGVRAVLAATSGDPVASAAASLAADARRDPARLWAAVEAALDGVRDRLAAVRAIAVDGTSGTILPVDALGEPAGMLLLYNDRAEPEDVAAVARVIPADSAAGGATSPLARALGLRRAGASFLLHEADWVAGRLLGRFDASDANNALKTGYDPRAGAWPDWIEAAGLPLAMLPGRVAEPGEVLGTVAPGMAARLGLPRDALVVAGTTDGCASFLATGAAEAGDGVTALGSTLAIKLLCDAPVFAPEHGIYSHRLLGRWLAGGASNTGGAALARFFTPGQLAELSDRINPGQPSGLDYYPLPGRGERFPVNDPDLPSRTEPRPADDVLFLHGLLQGIARVEALGYRRLRELGGPRPRRVLSVGAGAANPAWTQLRAQALGVPVAAVPGREAAFGAALLARRALQ